VAALAVLYQVAFVAVRVVSLHAIDQVLRSGVGPLRVNHVLELAGLSVAIASAVAASRARPANRYRPATTGAVADVPTGGAST
jgi:hypothetical protein